MLMKIGVIGGGSWGTALARLLADQGHEVLMWVHEPTLVESIDQTRQNSVYLDGIDLPENLRATNDIEEAVSGQEMIVSVPPSHVLREVMVQAAPYLPEGVPIVSATKGI